MFTHLYGVKEVPKEFGVIKRIAAKAIVQVNGKILLIHTNKEDYKIPGGGIKEGEKPDQTIRRELLEETGYKLKKMGKLLGISKELNIDKFDSSKYFLMINEYYLCEITVEQLIMQNLDTYEAELEFKPVFIDISKAIESNEKLKENSNESMNSWIERDTNVLKEIMRERL